jgi:hypothetical protein
MNQYRAACDLKMIASFALAAFATTSAWAGDEAGKQESTTVDTQ